MSRDVVTIWTEGAETIAEVKKVVNDTTTFGWDDLDIGDKFRYALRLSFSERLKDYFGEDKPLTASQKRQETREAHRRLTRIVEGDRELWLYVKLHPDKVRAL